MKVLPATESTDGALIGDNGGGGLLGASNSRGSELTASSEADGGRGGGLHYVVRRGWGCDGCKMKSMHSTLFFFARQEQIPRVKGTGERWVRCLVA